MEKITFYGKDYSPLVRAKYSRNGLERETVGTDTDELELLKKFCDSYEKNKKIPLRFAKNRELFFRNVGVFHQKNFRPDGSDTEYDVTLEISCRFDDAEEDADKKDANKADAGDKAFFLAAMLLSQSPEALKQIPDAANITFHQVMDIFLLFMYKRQLAEAVKKGIFRKYQRFENNDSHPHGTIDIARHIRENMGLKSGSIAYHYRELTANNPANRLILAAYKRLCEKYPQLCEKHISSDEGIYSTLKMLQTELGYSGTSVRNIVKENLRPITHPYFSEYEDLRKTCLKILRDENVWIFDSDDCTDETESLYMNVTQLWEQFLEVRLNELLAERKDLSLTAQGKTQEKGLIQILAGRKDWRHAKPDLVLWQGEQAVAILDVKFKRDWGAFFSPEAGETNSVTGNDSRKYKYDRATIDDDINKCIRDMAVFQARRTGVIFPFPGEDDKYEDYHIGKSPNWFDIVQVPVPPKGEKPDFKVWYDKLVEAVKEVLKEKYLAKAFPEGRAQQPAAGEAG